jgi:hypothetical protein
MAKQAHIISHPQPQIGEKVLGLCGTVFKYKTAWADIPDDKPICRRCINTAIDALREADRVIDRSRMRASLLSIHLDRLAEELEPDRLLIDTIAQADADHRDALEARRVAKAERKQAKRTCTCTWTSPEVFTEDPNCPIHGGTDTTAELIDDDAQAAE